jgi:hypothetical protein
MVYSFLLAPFENMANFCRCFPPFCSLPTLEIEVFLLLGCTTYILYFTTFFNTHELSSRLWPNFYWISGLKRYRWQKLEL